MLLSPQPLDILRHDHRLLPVRKRRLQLQLLTMLILREHILRNLPFISLNQRVRRLHYQLRRTVILLQLKELRIRILTLEVQDIVDVRTTERINTLCIIAHHTHLLTFFRQLIDDGLLGKVRVLILIHQHKMELLYIFLADILVILEQYPCLNEQIVEVHRIRLSTAFRVPCIYSTHLRPLLTRIIPRPCTLCVSLRQQQVILRHRDTICHRGRLIYFIIESHLLDDRLHQRARVTLVVDGKA